MKRTMAYCARRRFREPVSGERWFTRMARVGVWRVVGESGSGGLCARLDENSDEDREKRRGQKLGRLPRNLGHKLHREHRADHNQHHKPRRRVVASPPVRVRPMPHLKWMELRETDDDGEAAAEAIHDRGGHERHNWQARRKMEVGGMRERCSQGLGVDGAWRAHSGLHRRPR